MARRKYYCTPPPPKQKKRIFLKEKVYNLSFKIIRGSCQPGGSYSLQKKNISCHLSYYYFLIFQLYPFISFQLFIGTLIFSYYKNQKYLTSIHRKTSVTLEFSVLSLAASLFFAVHRRVICCLRLSVCHQELSCGDFRLVAA